MLRTRDVNHGSWILPIPGPGSRIRNQQHFLSWLFFVATNITKLKIYFWIRMVQKKKKLSKTTNNCNTFCQKTATKLWKIWVWEPGFWNNPSRIQGSKRRRIPDPDPQHWVLESSVWHMVGEFLTELFFSVKFFFVSSPNRKEICLFNFFKCYPELTGS